ncbi:MAG: cytochrome C oxidase subunit IV family protein [Chloroflexota bacterium]
MHSETHAGEQAHPGFRTYINIALILTVITAIEVAVYYVDALRPALVPVLLSLSVVKFVLVVGYFMHLKYDPKLLTGLFVFGLAIAAAVFIGLGGLFHYAGNTIIEGGPGTTTTQPSGAGH